MEVSHHHMDLTSYRYKVKEEEDDVNTNQLIAVPDDSDAFANIHMCRWDGKHCEEWAAQVCRKRGVDAREVDLRGFRAKDGITLQNLARQGFCDIVGDQYGAMFWKELRSYRAMQKQRCTKCVGGDSTLPTTIHYHDSFDMQEMASDLSVHNHVSSSSMSPSLSLYRETIPRCYDNSSPLTYREVGLPYSSRVSPESYPRYTSDYLYSDCYEGSPSPSSLEPIIYRNPSPSSEESYGRPARQRDSDADVDAASIYIKKPMPGLILIEDVEFPPAPPPLESLETRTEGHGYLRPGQPVHSFHKVLPRYVAPGRYREGAVQHPSQIHDLPLRKQSLTYAQESRPSQKEAYGHPPSYEESNHLHAPFIKSSESDYEDEDAQEEPGRLIIDLGDEGVDTKPDVEAISTNSVNETNESVPHLEKIPTKRKRDRGPKSWEFLMRLLACPKSNPSIIRWEDEAAGSFRLVQPQMIADMWATRSNKYDLSYNNFARALRYHYKKNLLYRISERQLVYGCGPVAIAFYNQVLKERSESLMGDNPG